MVDIAKTLALLAYAAEDGRVEHAAALLDTYQRWRAAGGDPRAAEYVGAFLVRWCDEPDGEPFEVNVRVSERDDPSHPDDLSIAYHADPEELAAAAVSRRLGDFRIAETVESESFR